VKKKKRGDKYQEENTEENEESSKKKPKGLAALAKRMFKRKKEVDSEKEEVKRVEERKIKRRMDSKIIGAITGLGGFLVKGLGSIFMSGIGLLGKSLLGILARVLPGAAGRALGSIVGPMAGGVARATGKLVWAGAKMAGRAAVAAIPGIAQAAAPVLVGIGQAALATLTAPATLTILGAAAVGAAAYFGYKYFTRNKLADNIYGRATYLRLLMYGFDLNRQKHFHKLFKTEDKLKDFLVISGDQVNIKPLTEGVKKDICDIFDVSQDNKTKSRTIRKLVYTQIHTCV